MTRFAVRWSIGSSAVYTDVVSLDDPIDHEEAAIAVSWARWGHEENASALRILSVRPIKEL